MKIDLTKEEIGLLSDCIMSECIEIGKNRTNKFVNQDDLEKYSQKILSLLDKINSNESEAK